MRIVAIRGTWQCWHGLQGCTVLLKIPSAAPLYSYHQVKATQAAAVRPRHTGVAAAERATHRRATMQQELQAGPSPDMHMKDADTQQPAATGAAQGTVPSVVTLDAAAGSALGVFDQYKAPPYTTSGLVHAGEELMQVGGTLQSLASCHSCGNTLSCIAGAACQASG